MDVSVVIATWNNSKRLRVTLSSIKACIIPQGLKWELVIINNNCTDDTKTVISQLQGCLPIVYLKEDIQGKSRALNKGLKSSRGKLIIFTDDDVTPCQDWIKIYWEAYLQCPERRFWGGPIESEFEGVPPDNKLLECAPASIKGFDCGNKRRFLDDSYFLGANWAVPRKVMIEVGGFDVTLGLNAQAQKASGEEIDLMFRIKQKGWVAEYLPDACLKHFVPASKCALEHIVKRKEISAYATYYCYRFDRKLPIIAGLPSSLILKLIYHFVLITVKRFLRVHYYKNFIEYRVSLGFLRGFLDSR